MIAQPSFPDFYAALHGRAPFPWQERLALQIARKGTWPVEVGVPTGLGKTACLDIAVWSLASQAHVEPRSRTAATRIWWLVNRRLLVDATTDHADALAERLCADDDGPIAAVAGRLRALSADPSADPLQVVRLRGGVASSRPLDPSQPAVILSTIPMYGSRLLFRGYGSSRSMRPVDAALAGADALVLVDEAHLAHHLTSLFAPLADCDAAHHPVLADARLRPAVVSLTATGSATDEGRFDLDEDDLDHPVVAERLDAAKPTQVVELPARTKAPGHLAAAAVELLSTRSEPGSCVVFTNTPGEARNVEVEVRKRLDAGALDLVVLTGRQRERESLSARRTILDPVVGVAAGRGVQSRERHLVVVATQTLEVGADVDFEYLVTEACGVRALTQRLGRLNRLGRFPHARATYVHAEPASRGTDAPGWPVYGEEPLTVIVRLRAASEHDAVDLSPRRVAEVLGPPGDDPGRGPEVLPALLWEWVKTTTPPPGEAPVEPFFSGLAEPDRRVSVCWRAHLPAEGQRIWPRVRPTEVIELPLREAREALEEQAVHQLGGDRVTVEVVDAARLAPGSTVILASSAGLLDEHGWNPQETTRPVPDVSLAGQGVPLDADALRSLVVAPPVDLLTRLLGDEDLDDEAALLAELVDALSASVPVAGLPDEWHGLVASLDLGRGVVEPPGEVPRLVARAAEDTVRVDALDELSAGAAPRSATGLDAHGKGVAHRARAVAEAVGVRAELVPTIEAAALMHDVGKADPRFQRWLDPTAASGELLAKSSIPTSRWQASRPASGWPAGGRHEVLSARLVEGWLDALTDDETRALDALLLVHLVVSHHGHARPLVVPVDDATSVDLVAQVDGRDISVGTDLSRVDWDQPRRFRRLNDRYGHWGLALLEAVVRQADHAVSAGGWAGDTDEVL